MSEQDKGKTLGVRYVGRKDYEIDQWMGTGISWPYRHACVQMQEDKARKLAKMLPSEFEIEDNEDNATLQPNKTTGKVKRKP